MGERITVEQLIESRKVMTISAATTKVLPWRVGILLVTSLVCVSFPLEEERVMQHRSSKYFPQFENQGIDPEGGPRQV